MGSIFNDHNIQSPDLLGDTAKLRWYFAVILLALICARAIWLFIYRLFLHPLAKYPGPLASKLSDIPIIFSAAQCKATCVRYDLHQKYGSVVRTGLNELCFADATSIKDIYGQSAEPCLKSPTFYGGFTLTGTESVFSATDRYAHARMRRLLSHGFSQSGVGQFQGEIIAIIEKFLAKVELASQPCDIHDLAHNMFLDTTSQLAFAKSFNLLDGERHRCATDIETYFSISPLFGIFPVAKYLPFGIFKQARQARPRITQSVQAYINDFRNRLQHGIAQHGLFKLMVEAKDSETGRSFTDEELIENAVLFIIAGSGTTASTLLYLIYEVGKIPEIQARLVSEIRTAFPDPSMFPSLDTATNLEVLRLRGPIPTVAPRISPGKIIGGQYVPAGVVVSNLAYTSQRDPEAFPQPHQFLPERWEQPTPLMKIMHRPFSTGPRNCIGMHLARAQLLLAVSALYQRFDITIEARMTDEMMILHDQGVMSPVGKQLWITAKPVNRS